MANTTASRPLRSGELARLANVSADTLRHYERRGLLPAPLRTSGGYRQYPAETLERVRMIRCALALGFTVDELSHILRKRDRGEAPCRDVRALAGEKLTHFEARQRELALLCRKLRTTLHEWDRRLAQQKSGRAGLLQELARRLPDLGEQGSPLVQPALQKKRKRK